MKVGETSPMECIYTLGTSSASHTYGNVAAAVKEYILQYFPRDFFTYTYIDSKIAWKNINEILGNGDAEFKKRHYPFMIISPRFSSGNEDRFLSNTPLTINMDNTISGLRRNTLFPVIMDKEHQTELAYKINRDRVEFEIEARLKTLSQQLDVFKNLQNQMIWDRPYLVPVALESMIPRSMIEYISKMAGIDCNSKDIPLIMRFLNGHSRNPITYKVRTSTSVDEFFLYYKTKLLLTFTDLELGDANKNNAVDEYYSLRFRVTVDFNLPGLYALIGTHEKKFHGLKFEAMVSTNGANDFIPIYTYTNLYDRYDEDTMDGFTFYSSTIVQTEECRQGRDEVIAMDDVIPSDHVAILRRIIDDGVQPETIFRFRLLKNAKDLGINCETEESLFKTEWDINWDSKQIIIHQSDPLMTYRIIIYANLVQLNAKYAMFQDKTKSDIQL